MTSDISKTRSKKSKLRDKEESRKRKGARPRSWSISLILLALLLWLSGFTLLYLGGGIQYSRLTPGQKAPATVVSSVEFDCVDISRTELNRRQAAETVPPVFSIHFETLNTVTRDLDKLFDKVMDLRSAAQTDPDSPQIRVQMSDVLDLLGFTLRPAAFMDMLPQSNAETETLLQAIKNALREIWSHGIVSRQEKNTAFQGIADNGAIRIEKPDGTLSKPFKLDHLPLPSEAVHAVVQEIQQTFTNRPLPDSVLRALVAPGIIPNLTYNNKRTAEMREQAGSSVEPVVMSVRSGTTLVENGERITPSIHEKLREHRKRLLQLETPVDRMYKIIGDGSLLMIALVVCAGLLKVIKPDVLYARNKILLLMLLSLLTLLPAKGLLYVADTTQWISSSLLMYMIPLAVTPLLTTILINSGAAIAIGFWTSFATALLLHHNFMVLTTGLLVTTVAAHAAQGVHRRSRVFRAGLWVGLAEILCAITMAVVDQQAMPVPLFQALTALANGLLCAFLTLLLIPLFETLFGITTDITLLELSDLSNPVLQRLAMEAPGTYHHSLMVASLSQAAAQEVGANALLVRVSAYFHDIGKLTKPEFFIENAQFRDNPHDDLAPSMSTLVVTSHVKEGVTLARRHKLPRLVVDAIQQHHGSGLVSYFYHRARQQQEAVEPVTAAQKTTAVKEEDYRYPGPRPQSREMAILSLADSVEAASRSMEKPTASRIENLVSEIVNSKLLDGQLDDCDLTLSQLAAIKKSFVFTLMNMLHGRIAYPQDENRNKQSTKKTSNGAAPDKGTAAQSDTPNGTA